MTRSCNCYALEPTLSAAAALRAEFGLGPMHSWLAQVRRADLHRVVPQLIVKLDRMSRVALSVTERRNFLRALERPLLDAVHRIPKPPEQRRPQQPGEIQSLTLEQRLYCLVVKNLKQLLADRDAYTANLGARNDKGRRWVLQNLFFYLGRQIEFGLFRGLPLPQNTWLELHQVYGYVATQELASADLGYGQAGPRAAPGEAFDPDREYKRLLLLGLAGRLNQDRRWGEFVQERIADWVADTSLRPPEAYVGELDLYVVETGKDVPPRQVKGALKASFRGWILMRRAGFLTGESVEGQKAFAPTGDSGRLYAVGW